MSTFRRGAALLAGAVALALPAAGCHDALAPKPNDVLAPENFYKSSADAVAATNAVYQQTRARYFLGFWYASDMASDEVIASPTFGSDGHRASNYGFDANEWWIAGIWGDAYTNIDRANAVIGRVPAISMDTTLRARLVGEARFQRALAYFDLVRYFGDVPLVTTEVTSLSGLTVPRTPAAEVYATIISDLQAAAAVLPASYSSSDIGRATSGAALSLLAKVYLTQKDWSNAAKTAGQVMTGGTYALLPNFTDVFRIATAQTNKENIFSLNYAPTLDPGNGSVVTLFTLPVGFPGGDAYGLIQVLPSAAQQYAANDARGLGATFATSPYVIPQGSLQGDTVTWAVPGGAAIIKYFDPTDAQNTHTRGWVQQGNNWIVLRYADVLLMYAEAVNEGGTPTAGSAEAALNLVRKRAGIPTVTGLAQANMRDTLHTERLRELMFEGHRWFDLSRWGTLDATFRAKTAEVAALLPGETTPHGVPSNLMPIPQSQINIDPKLTQNAGW